MSILLSRLFASMPLWLFYRFSDLAYFFCYVIGGYRKSVVRTNLRNAFPDKSESELNQIEKGFYRWFFDFLVESAKALTISKSAVNKRMAHEGLEVYEQLAKAGRSCILAGGHKGNWEWSGLRLSQEIPHELHVIYRPLTIPEAAKVSLYQRTRFGAKGMPDSMVYRQMLALKDQSTATVFIADQTPDPSRAHWLTFLNQDTPVFKGVAQIAQKLNQPIVYIGIHKVKRGYYTMKSELLIDNPAELSVEDILAKLHGRLEEDIVAQPETWLWSHRRWKHKRLGNGGR